MKLLSPPKEISDKKKVTSEKPNRLFEPISNKSFIISQITILSVGLLFAGLMYFFLQRPLDTPPDLQKYIPVTSEPISFNLDIDSPENNSVVFDNETLVNGTTSPHATVVISTEDSDLALSANDKGAFSQTITLTPGLNTLVINTFDENGDNKSERRSVYYSEEKL